MDFVLAADWHAQKANHFRGFVIFSPYYTSIIHALVQQKKFIKIEVQEDLCSFTKLYVFTSLALCDLYISIDNVQNLEMV